MESYRLRQQVEVAKSSGQDLLDELVQQLDEQIAEARKELASVS
jgi:hypothetical protein